MAQIQLQHGAMSVCDTRGGLRLAAIVVAILLSAPPLMWSGATPANAVETKRELTTIILPIEGMSCVACAATVRKTLKALDGVASVEVNLEKRVAQITYATNRLSADQIVAAVNKLGYRAGAPKQVE